MPLSSALIVAAALLSRLMAPAPPETIYEYYTPAHGEIAADSILYSGLGGTRDLPRGTAVSEPERTYQYYEPARARDTTLKAPDPADVPAGPPPQYVDPETRFQYYVPARARTPPATAPKPASGGGSGGTKE